MTQINNLHKLMHLLPCCKNHTDLLLKALVFSNQVRNFSPHLLIFRHWDAYRWFGRRFVRLPDLNQTFFPSCLYLQQLLRRCCCQKDVVVRLLARHTISLCLLWVSFKNTTFVLILKKSNNTLKAMSWKWMRTKCNELIIIWLLFIIRPRQKAS